MMPTFTSVSVTPGARGSLDTAASVPEVAVLSDDGADVSAGAVVPAVSDSLSVVQPTSATNEASASAANFFMGGFLSVRDGVTSVIVSGNESFHKGHPQDGERRHRPRRIAC
jgi:hypothetical protein